MSGYQYDIEGCLQGLQDPISVGFVAIFDNKNGVTAPLGDGRGNLATKSASPAVKQEFFLMGMLHCHQFLVDGCEFGSGEGEAKHDGCFAAVMLISAAYGRAIFIAKYRYIDRIRDVGPFKFRLTSHINPNKIFTSEQRFLNR